MEREEQRTSPLLRELGGEVDNEHNNEERSTSQEKGVGRKEIIGEVKKQVRLAGPLVVVNLLQYCLQIISVMFVGHLGELSLAGASMATSFATVTGFSLLSRRLPFLAASLVCFLWEDGVGIPRRVKSYIRLGMASALDTFCGQSFGAKHYHMLGIHMQRAMFVLLLVSVPLAAIWASTRPILIACGQDKDIAQVAGTYACYMIPSLFAYGILQCLVKFLQTQNIVYPMMLSSGITALLHALVCWILVFKSGLGTKGAALANSFSYWINVLLLAVYVKFASSCKKTWKGFSKEALHHILTFVKLAIPSAVMVCLEMWSFELMVLISGLLPDPQLETSVLSISLNTASTIWMIPYGLSGAVSTRVSNELGAGHPFRARLAVCVVVAMAIIVGILVGTILISIRNIWGYAYSNEIQVVNYVAIMLPIVAISNFLDGLQCVLSGNARGCGWQKIGACINLGSYYLVGIPVGILLAFVFHVGGKGLWLGIICALIVQVLSLLTITIRTNWEEEARKASERVYDNIFQVDMVP